MLFTGKTTPLSLPLPQGGNSNGEVYPLERDHSLVLNKVLRPDPRYKYKENWCNIKVTSITKTKTIEFMRIIRKHTHMELVEVKRLVDAFREIRHSIFTKSLDGLPLSCYGRGMKNMKVQDVPKTILYTKRIHGCHECPSCFIHTDCSKYDLCLRASPNRKNGRYVVKHSWPKWCPCLKAQRKMERITS